MPKTAQVIAVAVIVVAVTGAERLVRHSRWYNGDGCARGRAVAMADEPGGVPLAYVALRDDSGPGSTILASFTALSGSEHDIPAGTEVVVRLPASETGRGEVVCIARDGWLLGLAGFLAALMVLAGGGRGLRGLAILVAVLVIACGLVGPLIAYGAPPFPSILVASVIMTLAISVWNAGRQRTTLAIAVGAFCGLMTVPLLALVWVRLLRLSGVYSWLTFSLWEKEATRGLDFGTLLAAGMTLSVVGVVTDLATGIASAVREVAEANPSLTRRELFASGLTVGRDIMGTELNTLAFAYVGANVGVLLLPILGRRVIGYELPLLHIANVQPVAVETAQICLGTIGLVLTIPITALAVSLLVRPARGAAEGKTGERGALHRHSGRWTLVLVSLACIAAIGIGVERRVGQSFHRYRQRPSRGAQTERQLVRARVVSAEPGTEELLNPAGGLTEEAHQDVRCVLLSGPASGQAVNLVNALSGRPDHDRPLRPGDRVLLQVFLREGKPLEAMLIEYARERGLIGLACLLLAVVVMVGHGMGLRATAALLVSGGIVGGCVVVAGLASWPALPTFLAAMFPMTVVTFLILCGATGKALAASLGAFGGILVGGLAAFLSARAMGFSGLHTGDLMALRLFADARGLDYAGFYVAGVLLGVAGVAMDVAIAVASAATEVRKAKPEAGRSEVFERALRVGRNVMTPMVLALLFAYLGMNLPILVLPFAQMQTPLGVFINSDPVAAEITRILAGSIGVVATVPITALVCVALSPKRAGKAPSGVEAQPADSTGQTPLPGYGGRGGAPPE